MMSNQASSFPESNGLSPSDQRHAIAASFMGWTLDAFDFFVLTFVVKDLLAQFGAKSAADILLAVTLTLAVRPLGAARRAPSPAA